MPTYYISTFRIAWSRFPRLYLNRNHYQFLYDPHMPRHSFIHDMQLSEHTHTYKDFIKTRSHTLIKLQRNNEEKPAPVHITGFQIL